MADMATIARPYANAAFDAAKSSGQLAEWSQGLGLLALASADDKLQRYLSSPSIVDEEKSKQLNLLVADAGDVSVAIQRFVEVLAENKRLPLLSEIFRQFDDLKAQEEKSLDVEVISAYELGDDEERQIMDSLSKRFEREIKLVSRVDASLLGGAVIRAGDTVIDGSVRGKIDKLAESLQRV